MVCNPRAPRVDVGSAELLGGHVLSGGGLHERRPADEDRAGALHDHRLVRHGGHIGPAGGARAHHHRDLRDPERRQARLVEEDPAEVIAVGEDLRLKRQEGATRVDEVDAGQPVLAATSCARRCFFTVSGKYEPPFTVASLATTMQWRPWMTPMPVTIPAEGASPS